MINEVVANYHKYFNCRFSIIKQTFIIELFFQSYSTVYCIIASAATAGEFCCYYAGLSFTLCNPFQSQ